MSVQSTNLQHLIQAASPTDISDAIAGVLNGHAHPIGLHEPEFKGKEWDYVRDCLDTAWVSSAGPYVDRFEQELADFTDIPHAVAVVNGTAALHTCLQVANIQPGDEVLLPAMTFVATANAVSYCQAIPHFVEIDSTTLGVDAVKLDNYLRGTTETRSGITINRFSGRPISALIVMHTLGHPVDLDPIAALCRQYGLKLIEDAAQALGSYYKDQHVGGHGCLSAFSFNGNKVITCGGGGAVLTRDPKLARKARHLTTTARTADTPLLSHDEIAYNYRMPNLNAALGCAQLEQLPEILRNKRLLADRYAEVLNNLDGINLFQETPFARHNHWLNALFLDPESGYSRDAVLQALKENEIFGRPLWTPMHRLPMYGDCPQMDLSTTEDIFNRAVCLPSSAFLGARS